ncbi:MAG: orotidine-5'-phosphate decarboxylase [Pseudomonadota bacterium]
MTDPKIFCAIDNSDQLQIQNLCESISSLPMGIKLGLEFFNFHGPKGVLEISKQFPQIPIFLDLKYYDIPNTVSGAIKSVTTEVRPAYINVHASGGKIMMDAAKKACPNDVKIIAVTILTSFDEDGITQAGYKPNVAERVIEMAALSKDSSMDGVVCSSHEIKVLREQCGEDFVLMVPGIRPAGSDHGDQKRVMTPKEALDLGATHLVIGRPISQADDPRKAAQEILNTL